jgi:hypothetical protein
MPSSGSPCVNVDGDTQEVPKHVEDCASIVFTL